MRTRFINIALLLIALICPWSAWAAPAHVQSPTPVTGSSGTTLAIAYGSNVTAGNLLVCHIYANHGISGVADSRSQTFTSAVNVTDGATYPLRRDYWRAKKLPGAIEYYVGNDGARDARRGRWARVVGWLSTALGRKRPLVGDDQGETDR